MRVNFGPPAHQGELPVSTNGGSRRPFGVLELGEGLEVILHGAADCERLIRAAARIKMMLERHGAPHQFTPMAGDDYRCDVCGDLNDAGHPKPPPPCPSTVDGVPCTVTTPSHQFHYGPADAMGIRRMWEDGESGQAAEQADPGHLEDAAARDDDEAGDPYLGHAPAELPRDIVPGDLDAIPANRIEDDSPFADPRHDPDAARAAGDDNPLRLAGGRS